MPQNLDASQVPEGWPLAMRYSARIRRKGEALACRSEFPHSLAGLSRAVRAGEVSPVEVTEALLGRIDLDETNAFITVAAGRAMEDARRAEAEISVGRHRGPLHGIPVAIKDLLSTAGVRTTMASAFFQDHVPDHDAAVARKLREAGTVLLGKTNTHEFAYGPTGDRSHFGPTRNPRDLARISGGSSGGSGTAVATGLCYGAVGSDTGGSIRIPAALCGVVGLKPTFGRVGKGGVFPLARTLDHVGPLTRTVEDNAILLSALAGHDPQDLHSVDRPPEDFAVHEERLRSEPERFDDQGLERLLKGEELRAYRYANAQERKLLSRREFEDVLGKVDVILAPSVPIPATEIGQRQLSIEGYEEAVYSALTRLTGPTNMNGLPSLSVPCGTTSSGLPVGLQIIGRPFDEATLYRFGHAYERSFN